PLTVNFDGSGSSDPDGNPITYSWDLNGDGVYGDSTAVSPTFTYNTAGTYVVHLKVTDSNGASTISSPITIDAGNTPPVPTIAAPASTVTWRVGDPISFSGSATDDQDGSIPASGLSWPLIMHHCPTPNNSHTHMIQTDTYAFGSWSDGGAQSHNTTGPPTAATYTATFTKQTSGTFGTTTIGASVDTASANLKEVSKYTALAANVTKLTGYVSGL